MFCTGNNIRVQRLYNFGRGGKKSKPARPCLNEPSSTNGTSTKQQLSCAAIVLLLLLLLMVSATALVATALAAFDQVNQLEAELGATTTVSSPSSQFLKWKRQHGGDFPSSNSSWKIWKYGDPILYESQFDKISPCVWTVYKIADGKDTLFMCVHPERDSVSNYIRKHASWPECTHLLKLWREKIHPEQSNLFLDIGSNVGACSFELLLHALEKDENIVIVAFEPHPRNLYRLTATLTRLGREDNVNKNRVARSVTVVPIAVGDETSQVTMAVFDRIKLRNAKYRMENFGGAFVQPANKKAEGVLRAKRYEVIVPVERIDSIFEYANPKLVKLDVEGYECRVIDGLGKLFTNFRLIFTEVFELMLQNAQCSALQLLERVRGGGQRTVYILKRGVRNQHWTLVPHKEQALPVKFNVLAEQQQLEAITMKE